MSKNITISKNVYFSKGENNAVILNYDNGMFYGLDSIGIDYWELIQKYKEFDLIVKNMLSKYQDASREMIELDLNELLEQLTIKGIIEVK